VALKLHARKSAVADYSSTSSTYVTCGRIAMTGIAEIKTL
jgi:hypothetical protein